MCRGERIYASIAKSSRGFTVFRDSLRMVQRCAFVRRPSSPFYMPGSRRADGVLSHTQLQFTSVSLDFDCLPSTRIISFSIYRARISLAASKFWIFFISSRVCGSTFVMLYVVHFIAQNLYCLHLMWHGGQHYRFQL